MRTRLLLTASIALPAALAGAAFAQDDATTLPSDPFADEPSLQDQPAPEIRFSFGGGYTHRFETDIDGGGEFSLDTVSFGLDAATDLTRDASITLRLNYGVASYDFGGTMGIGGMDPWSDIHTLSFGGIFALQMTNDLNVWGGPVFQFARESGADWGDSFVGGGIVGATYRVHDRLYLGGGLGIVSQIEDDVRVFPILIIEWAFSENWRISSRGSSGGRTSIEFTGIEVIWTPREAWEFALGGGSSFARFRLDDDGPVSEGVGEDESTPIWLRATWKPSNTFTIDAVAGMASGGELKIDDSDGDGVLSQDYDTASFIGVFGSVRF